MNIQKLVFIYNADSGLSNGILDSAHKIFSPETYDCSLCSLTFGVFTEKLIWKKFRLKSAIEMEFLHKDEFKKQYASKFGYKFSFPIILAETKQGLEVFVTAKEMSGLEAVEDLVILIEARV